MFWPDAILVGKAGMSLFVHGGENICEDKMQVRRESVYVYNDDWLAHISSGKLSGYCDLIGKLMLKGE